jgi:hypothetical protein
VTITDCEAALRYVYQTFHTALLAYALRIKRA